MKCKATGYSSEASLALLRKHIKSAAGDLSELDGTDIVVGIPFYNEAETVGDVVQNAIEGLSKFYPDKKSALLCVGSHAGASALEQIRLIEKSSDGKVPVRSFLLKERALNGRGWSIRAMMEIAAELHAHLVLLSADLIPRSDGARKAGFGPDWIQSLAGPLFEHTVDLVIPRYVYHHFDVAVQTHLAYPLIAAAFGKRIRQPITGEYGLSYKLLRICLRESAGWFEEAGTYGFDPWLITSAIVNEASICEVGMGLKFHKPDPGKIKMLYCQTVGALFEQIATQNKWWRARGNVITNVDTIGAKEDGVPQRVPLKSRELVTHCRREFNQYHQPLLSRVLPPDIYAKLEEQADSTPNTFYLSGADWARAVNAFLIAYAFETGFDRSDILNGLYPVFIGRLASFVREIEELKKHLEGLPAERANRILRGEAERKIEVQTDEFIRQRPEFLERWEASEAARKPYLPQLGSWEFIPNVGVVIPQDIEDRNGDKVYARDIYRTLLDKYRDEFKAFVHDRLDVPEEAGSEQILAGIREFMLAVENDLRTTIVPGSLHSETGLQRVVDAIMACFPQGNGFCIKEEVAYRIVRRHVPRNLVTTLPCTDLAGLLEMYDPHDALALASWTEEMEYKERVWHALEECAPEDFEHIPLKPLVVSHRNFQTLANIAEASGLNRITGRIVVGTLPKGKGGEFPRLRYFLSIVRNLVDAEVFGDIWAQFAAEEVEFGRKLVASKKGHWGRRVLSAHNMFENSVQRIVADRIREMSGQFPDDVRARLEGMADSYHLSITLSDARFVPCSAWTWASYSFKGGQGYPTPLSVLVERDWATYDFIVAYLKVTGTGDEDTLYRRIVELMGEGKESEDLREHLFGMTVDAMEVPVRQLQKTQYSLSGKMWRPVDGPILEPIEAHVWESRYVLNCAAVRLDGAIYILYRAFGKDETSRIGLAWTADGCHIDGRLDTPIFEPAEDTESHGCEDPRVTVIGDTLYMLYTAYDGALAQIAMASISKQDFLARNWDAWERRGLCFPGVANKDAVLYPEKINGKFAIYHRIDPNMWLSYADTLDCPWPRTGYRIVIGPRPGMMWDSIKVGAGAPPIKTEFGWLNIYHGVDYLRYYRIGVVLVDIDDPSELLYLSPNPVLEPEADFEIGKGSGVYWVPRVVFTCGAVPVAEKDVLDENDEIFVYYGAADTAIGVARGRVGDLIPEDARKGSRGNRS